MPLNINKYKFLPGVAKSNDDDIQIDKLTNWDLLPNNTDDHPLWNRRIS